MKARGGAIARRGEDAVAALLAGRGYTVLHRNLRLARGEIDIVARRGDTVCLVEVKSRLSRARGTPEDSVTPAKRRQLRRLGAAYCAREPSLGYRFDVAAVTWDDDGEPVVRYYENAFTMTEPP
jgi:putative endonuclease